MASLCHPWFTTTNLSYRFPIFETSATTLCGTTGIIFIYIYIISVRVRVCVSLSLSPSRSLYLLIFTDMAPLSHSQFSVRSPGWPWPGDQGCGLSGSTALTPPSTRICCVCPPSTASSSTRLGLPWWWEQRALAQAVTRVRWVCKSQWD